MKATMIRIAIIFTFLFSCQSVGMPINWWIVDADNSTGPWDGSQENPFQHIQDGIDASWNGDKVVALPGNYMENLNFLGKAITVVSYDGPESTIIDGRQAGSVVTFASFEGPSSVIQGFTITNGLGGSGYPTYSGGGVTCKNLSSPTITSNIITGNVAQDGGGITCFDGANPVIVNNIIKENTAGGFGGGIFCLFSSALITNNTLYGNAAEQGGGFYGHQSDSLITNTIFWGNNASAGPEIYVQSGITLVLFCDVEEGSGEWWFGWGCIDADPLFSDPASDDFHLSDDSPCINAGHNDAPELPQLDFEGDLRVLRGTVEMGADEHAFVYTLHVPYEYAGIQEAIDAVWVGDLVTILVAPDSENGGAYLESIHFSGKSITLKSTAGPEYTTIDGSGAGSVVTFVSGEGPDSVLEGFTIRNGSTNLGGGVFCRASSPTITNNIISGNIATKSGGGIGCCDFASPRIFNNVISNNSTNKSGGGIYCLNHSSPMIESNIISGNNALVSGGGITCHYSCSPVISDSVISENVSPGPGGGIFCLGDSSPSIVNNVLWGNLAGKFGGIGCRKSSPLITNNTISGNIAGTKGGGIGMDGSSAPEITNTVVWENFAASENEISAETGCNPSVTYCNVKGGCPGEGNINADPLYADASNADFHLRLASPCVDSGTNSTSSLPDSDYDGDARVIDGNWPSDGDARVDMGADELLPEIASRFGNTNASGASLANVLLLNGSAGDNRRVCNLSAGAAVTMTMNASPQGPNQDAFALYLIRFEPGLSDMVNQPYGIGISCMPMPLSNGSPLPPPFPLVNNIGYYAVLGAPILYWIGPAPCTILNLPSGFQAGTYTFQGYIIDNGSSGPGLSLTNAIVVKVQ